MSNMPDLFAPWRCTQCSKHGAQRRVECNPLAIDLYCGLPQTKFLLGANPFIEQLVAGGTEYPDHMRPSVAGKSPRSVALKFWAVCYFEYSILSACFARLWYVKRPSSKSIYRSVLRRPICLVSWPAGFILPPCPYLSEFPRSSHATRFRAISLIGIWWNYRKMVAATGAITAVLNRSFVFGPADSSGLLGAMVATPLLIWPSSLERFGTLAANEIIHIVGIPA